MSRRRLIIYILVGGDQLPEMNIKATGPVDEQRTKGIITNQLEPGDLDIIFKVTTVI